MNVLNFNLAILEALRNKYMVQLLVVLVEDVCVSFLFGNIGGNLYFFKVFREWGEDLAGLSELVKITANDDVCVLVDVQDGLYK